MKYRLQIGFYKRAFKKALATSQGILNEREGLIIRLENSSGSIGFGEIAPMHFLGSESFEDAKVFYSKIDSEIDDHFIASIDERLPCCRFAIHMAREMSQQLPTAQREFEVAALLSLVNKQAILHREDYRAYKFKIGVSPFKEETEAFIAFYATLPSEKQLRFDANGSFSQDTARKWLNFLDKYENVQFLEQPLPKGQETLMAELARDYRTSIALDESIANVTDFKKNLDNEWPGWLVIKPSLLGDIDQFRKLREQCDLPIVYSSVFETAIGVEAGLALAATDHKNNHALGFGTIDYFSEDKFDFHKKGPRIYSGKMAMNDFERIWTLCDIL